MVFTHAMMRTQYRVQLTTPGAETAVSTPLGALAGRKPQPADSRRAGELIELFVGEAGFRPGEIADADPGLGGKRRNQIGRAHV